MKFLIHILEIFFVFIISLIIATSYEIQLLSAFSLLFGILLFVKLINSFGKTVPFFELTFGLLGIQLLIAPFLDYYFFKNEIVGVMQVDEKHYFRFVTFSVLAIYIGFHLLPQRKIDIRESFKIKFKIKEFEYLGERLIWFGYLFYFISFFLSNFLVTTFAFLRFIGTIYLILSKSKRRDLYLIIVWFPFVFLTLQSAVFINLLIWSILLFSLYALHKKINKFVIYLFVFISLFFILILQSVKQEYRQVVWTDNSKEEVSLFNLMINQVRDLDVESLKKIGSVFNVRLSQGWVISYGLSNLNSDIYNFEPSYLLRDLLGILLPRFLYQNKVEVGSHEKFYKFTGYQLSDSTAMNLGIIGDAYLNFGLNYGIFACFILGLVFALMNKYYNKHLSKYPDLFAWSFLFYFMIMRAGNEFYIIMNWYVKTGIITILFFIYVRPFLIRRIKKNILINK